MKQYTRCTECKGELEDQDRLFCNQCLKKLSIKNLNKIIEIVGIDIFVQMIDWLNTVDTTDCKFNQTGTYLTGKDVYEQKFPFKEVCSFINFTSFVLAQEYFKDVLKHD